MPNFILVVIYLTYAGTTIVGVPVSIGRFGSEHECETAGKQVIDATRGGQRPTFVCVKTSAAPR